MCLVLLYWCLSRVTLMLVVGEILVPSVTTLELNYTLPWLVLKSVVELRLRYIHHMSLFLQ
jgi:hypothetical protein